MGRSWRRGSRSSHGHQHIDRSRPTAPPTRAAGRRQRWRGGRGLVSRRRRGRFPEMPTPKGHQHDVALDELDCTSGQAYLTGTDILARLPAIQRKIDAAAGHSTAGYVTGYPGSPLSGLDSLLRQRAVTVGGVGRAVQPGDQRRPRRDSDLGCAKPQYRRGEHTLRRRVRPLVRQRARCRTLDRRDAHRELLRYRTPGWCAGTGRRRPRGPQHRDRPTKRNAVSAHGHAHPESGDVAGIPHLRVGGVGVIALQQTVGRHDLPQRPGRRRGHDRPRPSANAGRPRGRRTAPHPAR